MELYSRGRPGRNGTLEWLQLRNRYSFPWNSASPSFRAFRALSLNIIQLSSTLLLGILSEELPSKLAVKHLLSRCRMSYICSSQLLLTGLVLALGLLRLPFLLLHLWLVVLLFQRLLLGHLAELQSFAVTVELSGPSSPQNLLQPFLQILLSEGTSHHRE